jgi:hypothetical protein
MVRSHIEKNQEPSGGTPWKKVSVNETEGATDLVVLHLNFDVQLSVETTDLKTSSQTNSNKEAC